MASSSLASLGGLTSSGWPLKPVREHPVPTEGGIEKLSPTQPHSDAMPSFRGADLVEGDMWGITPLDQLWCRVKFREARYEPAFTPLNVTPSIVTPDKIGGINWGGVAFDRQRRIVIVNSTLLPNRDRLIPRKAALASGLRAQRAGEGEGKFPESLYAQEGTPCGVASPMFDKLVAFALPK
jgi:quinoprotein glucose dehydrogenase